MNNTKILFLLFVGMMILLQAQTMLGMEMYLDIHRDAGVLHYRLNDKDLTRNEMTNGMAMCSSLFGSNLVVQLSCSTNVSVPELLQTISDIQESGLHLIFMMSPGVKNGTNGIYVINMDCSKMLDGLFRLQSGFKSTNDFGRFYLITNGVVVPRPPDPPPVTRRLNADVLPDPPRPEVPTLPKIEHNLPILKTQEP